MAENHERQRDSPGFPAGGTHRGQSGAAFFMESRMQFDGANKLHSKSGFGLHQFAKPLLAHAQQTLAHARRYRVAQN